MPTQSIAIQSPDENRSLESVRRVRRRRRQSAARAAGQQSVAAAAEMSSDHSDPRRQAPGVGGARILRRWSVADLIATAGGAPRAFA
jgi:hypothetical protein